MAKEKKSIILLEPDEAVRTAISALLRQRGWTVHAQATADDLGSLLEKKNPLALICESILSDMSAKRALKTGQSYKVPVVFLGHSRDVQSAVDLMVLGAMDFLEKPFPQVRLLKLLDSLANQSKS